MLSAGERADLEGKLADLESKSGIQLVVATVSSLGGEEIEPYANELFRAWKLGEAKKNNGVLFLIAPKEHRVRIEVGYGLEGTLTDATSSLIIANAVAPRFKAGDYDGGVARGVDDIITVLTTDSAEWQKKPELRAEDDASFLDAIAPFLVLLFILFVFYIYAPWRRRRRRAPRQYPHPVGRHGAGRRPLRRRRRRLFRRRRVVGRRRRLGELVMPVDPRQEANIEAAFSAAQRRTRAPIVCVLARASANYEFAPLLWSGLLGLITPWPLLVFTQLSAQRIFIAQLVVCFAAMAILSLTPAARPADASPRAARQCASRRAGAVLGSRARPRRASATAVLVYVSLAERYARVVAADAASQAIAQSQWQGLVDALVADLRDRGSAEALANAAARCADLLAPAFPPASDEAPQPRQHFHVV